MNDIPQFASDAYEPLYPTQEMDAAHYSPLTAAPTSAAAIEACRDLSKRLVQQTNVKMTAMQRKVLGALIADLLERDPTDKGGWLYRSMDAGKYTGGPIGYRPFIAVYSALIAAGMVEEVSGCRVWMNSEIAASGRLPAWQRATRFRGTPQLRTWFAERRITREDWTKHFVRDLTPLPLAKGACPVILRASKPPFWHCPLRARNLPFDKTDPLAMPIIARMERINAYLADVKVVPFGPVVLRRIFAHGDDPNHGWCQGGRMYAVGPSPYQTAKKALRREITINGAPTCELDIQASHLTILSGLGHVPRFKGDPYVIDRLPRELVKRWVNMTLSHGKRHTRWPPSAANDLLKDHAIDVKADYPLAATGDVILRHLPILKDDASTSVAVGWGELQFRESEVVLEAMETLAFKHKVPALPVHDSLIVPQEAKDLAKRALQRAFRNSVGFDPEVS